MKLRGWDEAQSALLEQAVADLAASASSLAGIARRSGRLPVAAEGEIFLLSRDGDLFRLKIDFIPGEELQSLDAVTEGDEDLLYALRAIDAFACLSPVRWRYPELGDSPLQDREAAARERLQLKIDEVTALAARQRRERTLPGRIAARWRRHMRRD